MLMKALFIAEMVTYLPIASPFIRLGGFWVDDAWGFAMGWNYFFLMGEYQFLCQFYDL
jgi:amino acid transporter